MNNIHRAYYFAVERHGNQIYGDLPYITHLSRVALLLEEPTEALKVAALLHDIVEDTTTTLDEIEELFGRDVSYIVQLLTHDPVLSYMEYINIVSKNRLATLVKIADLTDNIFNAEYIYTKYMKRANEVYKPALRYLRGY